MTSHRSRRNPDSAKPLVLTARSGKVIQAIGPIVGGKGGGRPDNARGGGKDSSKINEALNKAAESIGQAK